MRVFIIYNTTPYSTASLPNTTGSSKPRKPRHIHCCQGLGSPPQLETPPKQRAQSTAQRGSRVLSKGEGRRVRICEGTTATQNPKYSQLIGKSFSVKIEIDENLEPLLEVKKESQEGVLSIGLKGNYNNKMYIEDTRIKVKVTMPEASVIQHRGNSSLQVTGIVGRYFRIENYGNGNATLQGTIDELDVKKNGNGEVRAQGLIAKTAKVKSYGNGNVRVNAQISLMAHGSGNNSVMQFGPGKIDPMSGIMGNGEVRKM